MTSNMSNIAFQRLTTTVKDRRLYHSNLHTFLRTPEDAITRNSTNVNASAMEQHAVIAIQGLRVNILVKEAQLNILLILPSIQSKGMTKT